MGAVAKCLITKLRVLREFSCSFKMITEVLIFALILADTSAISDKVQDCLKHIISFDEKLTFEQRKTNWIEGVVDAVLCTCDSDLDQSISFEESQQIDCIDLQMKLANQKMDLSGFEALDTNYNDKIDTHEATHVLDITGMAISVVEFSVQGYKVR